MLVYTVNTADGNDALEPVDVKDGSSDSTTKDKEPWASYITWVERDASTVPFRIVAGGGFFPGLRVAGHSTDVNGGVAGRYSQVVVAKAFNPSTPEAGKSLSLGPVWLI